MANFVPVSAKSKILNWEVVVDLEQIASISKCGGEAYMTFINGKEQKISLEMYKDLRLMLIDTESL